MAKLSYTTTLSAFKKGDNSPCYTAHVKHNGTVSTEDFIKSLANLFNVCVDMFARLQ